MREKITQVFSPSTERFYRFKFDIDPAELRDLVDEAPESVLLNQKFQMKVVDAVRWAFEGGKTIEVARWLAVLNGFVARGICEDQLSKEVKDIVCGDLEHSSNVGDVAKFEKIKNIFRPILEQTITASSKTFERNLLFGLGHFRDNPEGFKKYVAELRRVAPVIFSNENVAVIAEEVITPILGKYYIEAPVQIIQLSEYLHEIPELKTCAADCVEQIHVAIQRSCLWLAHLYDKTWQEIFGKSVAEMDLVQSVNTAIIQREFEDIDIEPGTIFKLVTFFGLAQLTPGNAAELQLVCNALLKIRLLRDENPTAELLEYMSLFGVTVETMLTAPPLLDRWSKIIAANLDNSETPLDDFMQTTVDLGVEGVSKQKMGMAVGFTLIERGNYGKAATLHQSLGLSYLGDSGDAEITSAMQSGIAAAVEHILSSEEHHPYTNIDNLSALESATKIEHQAMLDSVVLPALKRLPDRVVFDLCHGVAGTMTDKATAIRASVFDYASSFIRAIAADAELGVVIQNATSGDFWRNNNPRVIEEFMEVGLLPDTYIYSEIRSIAVGNFITELQRCCIADDLKTVFKLTEADISMADFQQAACLGIRYKILGHDAVYEDVYYIELRTDAVYSFAKQCGIGGEHLAAVVRKALVECIAVDNFATFTQLVTAYGLTLEACQMDLKFRQAAQKCLSKKIETEPLSALRYIIAFDLDEDIEAVHKSICQAWSANSKIMPEVIESFPPRLIGRSFGERAITLATESKSISFESALLLNNHYVPPIDPVLYRTERVFGSFVGWKEYDYLCELLIEKAIPDELAELGISRPGEAGVEQLKDILHDFQRRIIVGEVTSTELGASSMLLGYYMDKTRVKVTEWGKTNAGDVVAKIKKSEQFHKNNPDATFNERYTPSAVLKVGTVKELKDFVFDEDFINRYRVLSRAILKAANDCDPLAMPLSKKVLEIEFCKDQTVACLESKLAEEPSEALTLRAEKEAAKKGIAASKIVSGLVALRNTQLQKSITTLRNLSLRSVRDIQNNFVALAEYKEFHALLLQTVFTFVFMQREHRGESGNENDNGLSTAAEWAVAGREPTLDGVTWSLNFIDHIVNKEVMAQYFTDQEAAKALRRIASVAAFEKQLAKMTALADDKKTSLQFIPTRGALLEFSGQIGDACWANKYNCIAAEFPNFTAVTMVERPGTESEKLAGSALLIEAESMTGKPLLIIRGLNPQESVINKLQVADFYEKFTIWARTQAAQMGRTLAIVIDDYSGGSATNRPILYQFLAKQALTMNRVRLSLVQNTEFNGYDITPCTYLIDEK